MDAAMLNQSPKKRQVLEDHGDKDKAYRFKVLLPNGTSVCLTLQNPEPKMRLGDFTERLEKEYFLTLRQSSSRKRKRDINWKGGCLFLEDSDARKIRDVVNFKDFKPHECHILLLHDGRESTFTFENMWDLTPVTDILKELPEEYTFETAMADLIDNSLQAVWANDRRHKKLISVDMEKDVISIFDTGPGMDGSDENSIVKWGKMGASLHRSLKEQVIGGRPPYLMPYFGMFGYGGPLASMHLGRNVLVSSKTKDSKKVYTLHLNREALLRGSDSHSNWKTDGGMRNPLKDEMSKTPHGSFTKVEIFEPNWKKDKPQLSQIRCKLKDIYFPYIQCDEESKSGKTITPINFEVNGVDLAEIEGGEIAVSNFHSCNGPDFVLQLRFTQDGMTKSPDSKGDIQANARLKCVYFPMVEGKENIERILENLESDGYRTSENFETYSRVSIRRLGRLLPDARWARLPFMEIKQTRGDKGDLLKRVCLRVKCFIETDAGFNPTSSKTDLAHHNPFTIALRNFGNQLRENQKDIKIEISRGGNQVTLSQLKTEYEKWILQMHEKYDDRAECGEDQPVLLVSPANKKALRISSDADVARLHKSLKRKGKTWERGQKIKLFKGACAGVHKTNVYATIEYFLLEGLEGDSGGEARIFCRPLSLSDEGGCILSINDGGPSLDIRDSLSVPVSVIDSGKCVPVESTDWDNQLKKQRQKSPCSIELLDAEQCQELEVDGALPVDAPAGKVPPEQIVAVIRPVSYVSSRASKTLDQKYIVRSNLEMSMEIDFKSNADGLQKVRHTISERPKSLKGIQGLYIFPLRSKYPDLFQSVGVYTFSFHLDEQNCKDVEKRVLIKQAQDVQYKEIRSTCPNVLLKDSSPLLQVENMKVPVMEVPKVELEEIQIPCSNDKVPVLKAPKVQYDESQLSSPDANVLHCQYSLLPHGENLKELEKDIDLYARRIGDFEKKLGELKERKTVIERKISACQASVEGCDSTFYSMKEELIKRIEIMSHTAASTVYSLSRVPSQESKNDFRGEVIGLVALLGRVRTSKLSRIFSEYLGDDQMLAVVCRSFADASTLEKYEHSEEGDSALYAEAAKLGRSINGRFLVIGLEDIRPYTGDFDGSDHQRRLAFPDPVLPSGNTPDGFLGYAVNMVDVDDDHLDTMTAAGHGLRQTLFYSLFGELHVYKTKTDMLAARACIKDGAVSLDGGMIKQTGAISLGYGKQPEICFPGATVVEVMKDIEGNKTRLGKIIDTIDKFNEALRKTKKKFKKQYDAWNKQVDGELSKRTGAAQHIYR